jgi:hypothetical protein
MLHDAFNSALGTFHTHTLSLRDSEGLFVVNAHNAPSSRPRHHTLFMEDVKDTFLQIQVGADKRLLIMMQAGRWISGTARFGSLLKS